MAVGKNPRLKTKKGAKKKTTDPFARKEWYDVKAPNMFDTRNVGKTIVSRTHATRVASDNLKGRIYEVSLADLNKNEEQAHRKIKLRAEDVKGKNVITNFHGMDLTTDKLRSLVRKWQSLIEAHVDVKTTDGFFIRLFAIAFTKRRPNALKKTAYAQTSQIRTIRRKMMDIMTHEATTSTLRDLVVKFIPESIATQIEKECQGIYPLQNVFIRKVKVVKTPKFDNGRLVELYGEAPEEDRGAAIAAAAAAAAEEAKPEEAAKA